MNFKVIDHHTMGKSIDQKTNEDFVFIGQSYFAVIDGATTTSPTKFNSETPGRAIGKIIVKALSTLQPNLSFQQAFTLINNEICQSLGLCDSYTSRSDPANKPSASIAIVSAQKEQLWILGDCLVLIDGEHMSFPKTIDIINAQYRSFVNQTSLMDGTSYQELQEHDIGREKIMYALKKQRTFQNSKNSSQFSYGALDGSKNAIDFVRCVDIANVKNLIIATDGYPKLFESLAETETYLENLLKSDPLMIFDYPQTKGLMKDKLSFDDRAFLHLTRTTSPSA